MQEFTPNLIIVLTATSVDCNQHSDFPFKIKPNVSVYHLDSNPSVKTDTSLVEILIEFKCNSDDDLFCDPHDVDVSCSYCRTLDVVKSFLHETKSSNATLSQVTSYAAAQLTSQYCTHVYSVFIMKNTARILLWDRSGTIMMEAIEYNESPLLAKFFHHYSVASVPTPVEAAEARQVLGLGNDVPLVKLQVPGACSSPLFFITSAPQAMPYMPPGCATCGGPAYNVLQRKRVFLKDSWRVDLPDIQAERLTYKMLKDTQVHNIPHCLASGDISTTVYHTTKAHIFTPNICVCCPHSHVIPH